MLVHCQFDFFSLPMIELSDIFSLDSPAKQQVLFVRQPFNLGSFRAIFGPAIFYGSRSDSSKFSVSLSAWMAAEVFSHSLMSNKDCLLWTSCWISRLSFRQCVTKSNQLTITWHIEMKSTSAAIFIFRREQIKGFSRYKQGTDARRLHYFYGCCLRTRASNVVRNEVDYLGGIDWMAAEEDILCRTPLITVVIV